MQRWPVNKQYEIIYEDKCNVQVGNLMLTNKEKIPRKAKKNFESV